MTKKNVFIFCILIALFTGIISCSAPGSMESNNSENNLKASEDTPVTYEETVAKIKKDNPDLPEECVAAKADYLMNTGNSEDSRSIYDSNYNGIYGTWGGSSGGTYRIIPSGGARLHFMVIKHGSYIDSIQVWYRTPGGSVYYGGGCGGSSGGTTNIPFSNDEYIRLITGKSGSLIDRLTIYTNKKVVQCGGSNGGNFTVNIPSNQMIAGFYGKAGRYVDQIGFYSYSF